MKPKKLNIYEMWDLYLNMKSGLVEDEKQYLVDEVSHVLDKVSPKEFSSSIKLLYPFKDLQIKNPLQIVLIFIRGLKMNHFFTFVDFVQSVTNDNTRK